MTKSLIESIVKDLTTEAKAREADVDIQIMGDGLFKAQPKLWLSTGIDLLDAMLEGGIPFGRVTEIFGKETTGKSLIILSLLAQGQKMGAFTGYFDSEQATTQQFAEQLAHIDPKKLLLVDANTMEEAYDASYDLIERVRERDESVPIVIAIDSIAAYQVKAERDGYIQEDVRMAEAAKKTRQWLRTITRKVAHENVAIVFTNHETAAIKKGGFGQEWTTACGTGGRFGASLRLRLQVVERGIKEGGELVGSRIRVQAYKTRFSAPWRELDIPLYFDRGLDNHAVTVDFLYKKHFFGQKSGYYIWEGKSYRRKDILKQVREDDALAALLKEEALKRFSGAKSPEPTGTVDGEE